MIDIILLTNTGFFLGRAAVRDQLSYQSEPFGMWLTQTTRMSITDAAKKPNPTGLAR